MSSTSTPPNSGTKIITDIDDFPDPPSLVSLSNAKLALNEHLESLQQLSSKINEAEAHLAQIVLEARCAINEMTREKSLVEDKISRTQSYLAPIRRLPSELLGYVFNWCFQDHPCCAWILAGVCRKWRRLALNMPRIWSKIRLLTTQHSSPDIIRLWLERSGPTVPLDIEIYLRVVKSSPDLSPNPRIRSRRSTSPTSPTALFYSTWSTHHQVLSGGAGNAVAGAPVAHYVIPHPSTALPPAHTPLIVPFASQPVTPIHDGWDPWIPSPPPSFAYANHLHRDRRNSKHDRSSVNGPRNGNHWGWIAMFYLVEQIHRWERFVFRFDKHFNSIASLKSINGDAPLLKEFEVSCAEPALYHDCSWLPNLNFPSTNPAGSSSSQHVPSLPYLQSLTLQNAPFKWSSPMFHTDLHTLNLRALPTSHISLDRIFHILHANRSSLKCLSLHFQCVTQTVLPLNPLLLPELMEFSMGGHHYLSQLVEILTMPNLEELNLDIDARDPIEDIIAGIVSRMGTDPTSTGIRHLSVAYGYGCGRRATKDAQRLREKEGKNRMGNSSSSSSSPISPTYPTSAGSPSTLYYGTGTIVSWAFLADMNQLESLRVGGTPMDTLLSALGAPDDDLLSGSAAAAGVVAPGGANNSWLCPNLSEVALKHCHAHSEGIGKLVQFVDARNPDGIGLSGAGGGSGAMVVNGVAPTKLTSLELYECAVLGPDVLEWLKGRVDEVQVSELPYERSPLSPY